MLSLKEYLARPNPSVTNKVASSGTTKNPRWDLPREIRMWKDFDLNSFNALYGTHWEELLKLSMVPDQFPDISPYPFCEIRDEDSLDTLLILSNQSIVSKALAAAQANLQLKGSYEKQIATRPESIFMARGGQASLEIFRFREGPKRKPKRYRPDWAGVELSDSDAKPKNLVPGDTKLSKIFDGSKIKSRMMESGAMPDTSYWPIAQIFTYCMNAGTRYGYLITDKELFMVHVCPTSPAASTIATYSGTGPVLRSIGKPRSYTNKGILEFKAVPWNHDHDSDGLTVNLCLFWLHLMARADGDMAASEQEQESQPSNGPDTQESDESVSGVKSRGTRTTPRSDSLEADFQGQTGSSTSETSVARRRLSNTAISRNIGDSSPLARKGMNKKRKNSEVEEKGTRPKRGEKRHKSALG